MPPEGLSSGRPSLASLQTAALALITGRTFGAVVPEPDTIIAGDARASAAARVQVYAHMYRARIVEALASQFPRLARLVGDEAFGAMAAAYIDDHPSRHPSLREVGQRLPGWLAARRPESPALVGLARLEWARTDVFDLADDQPLSLDALRAWPAERFGELPLQLVTAHRLITADGGTAQLWDSLAGDSGGGATDVPGATESFVVWRDGTVVYHRALEAAEAAALTLAAAGTRFGVVCESLLATHAEEAAVAQAFAWLTTWVADRLLRVV